MHIQFYFLTFSSHKEKKRLESCWIYCKVEREIDHGRLQQSNLTPIGQFFHSHLFPTAKMATSSYHEASLLILNAEFERIG